MSSVSIIALAAGLLSAMWCVFGALARRAVAQVPVLSEAAHFGGPPSGTRTSGPPAARTSAPTAPLPSLSVVVTARDEALEIEKTVRRLLAQRYPALEVIIVDDRSTDGTSTILDRLQREEGGGRLGIIHNRELPPGWLGKCHACHLGAARAKGEWILFMDGDVALGTDDFLERAVGLAVTHGYDHIAVIPDQRPVSAFQQALLSVFAQMYLLAARAWEIDRDLKRGGAGIGAFNLVRRAAYDRIGGHTLLKMDPTDDYKLGRLLKESGARQRLFDGIGVIRCPWHKGALNVARGLEKNFFAGFDYSVVELILFTLVAIGFVFGPLALALWATLSGVAAGRPALLAAAWLPFVIQTYVIGSGFRVQTARYGGNALVLSLLYPAAVLLLLAAGWNSAVRALARGGIRWRDTFYPLRELRRGRVRAGAGRRLPML